MNLPRYKCHKEVEAVKIAKIKAYIDDDDNITGIIIPFDSDIEPINVKQEYLNKHEPEEGGYYVRYADGYESFSPAEAFEAGYKPAEALEMEDILNKSVKLIAILEDTLSGLLSNIEKETLGKSEEELKEDWYFRWEDGQGLEWNLYLFMDMLSLYKKNCEEWEEHHNGSCCVVERVRDKYLWPRINEFLEQLKENLR